MTSPLMKDPLYESERREWKSWLKAKHSENEDHGIRCHHFMANTQGTVETVADFSWGGGALKTTADGDRKHFIKRRLDGKLQPNYTAY